MSVQIPLDLNAAMQRAERGIESSAEHANNVESEWTGQALGVLCTLAADMDDFTVEEVRLIAEAKGLIPLPPDNRAWGAVTRRALHKKRMVPTGERRRCITSNGSKKDVYRLVRRA